MVDDMIYSGYIEVNTIISPSVYLENDRREQEFLCKKICNKDFDGNFEFKENFTYLRMSVNTSVFLYNQESVFLIKLGNILDLRDYCRWSGSSLV